MSVLLEVKNITKKFSGVTALRNVHMTLKSGRVTALIGENGAGKSTLLKIMSGIYTDYEGVISYKGKEVRFTSPKEAQEKGIAIIHQELNLIPYLNVAQNIFLGREITNRFGFLDKEKMYEQTKELLHKLNLSVEPWASVSSIKVGQQQIIEIAKALLSQSEVVFMDEPTSAIGDSEAEMLFEIINQLKAAGSSIVYISHKLDELYKIADDFVVLRDGELVGQGLMSEISRDALVHMMAGRDVNFRKKDTIDVAGNKMLEVEKLNLPNPVHPLRPIIKDVSFALHKGEVLGIYGLMGAGRTELCECLFGLRSSWSGQMILDGKEVHFDSPIEAIKGGMALVPEDRKQDGIVAGLSVSKNMSMTVLDKLCSMGWLDEKKESDIYDRNVDTLKIKVNSAEQWIRNLSGGNQQKVVLAKWIETNPKVLILDEPTRGIDVNAKNEIYELINFLAESGMSILMISSEIPEILAAADRILVMSEGEITATFSSSEATDSKLINACIPETAVI